MSSSLFQSVRRRLRTWRAMGGYPILLPHFSVLDDAVRGIDGSVTPLAPPLVNALRLCDGSRTLARIVADTGAGRTEMMRLREEGKFIVWPKPLPSAQTSEHSILSMILSPHPDDAPLSAFSGVFSWPRLLSDFMIVNVFSRTAWWRFDATPADVAEIRRVRDAEEHLACRLTRARPNMLDLPEALLRGYSMHELFQPPVASRDEAVRRELATAISDLVKRFPRANPWLLPLGVGAHVDHLIVRDVALRTLEEANVARGNVLFYEDQPYVSELSGSPDFSGMIGGRKLRVAFTSPVGRQKLECLRAYWSQLTWSQIEKVVAYSKRLQWGGAERFWMLAD